MASAADTLAGNLRVLELALGRPITLPSDATGPVTIEPGPPMTAYLRDDQGSPLLFHSRRNPIAEAEGTLAAVIGDDAPASVVVIGAGLGYLPEAIERKFPGTRVLVIEPEPAFARHMLSRRDWRERIGSGRLILLVGPDYHGTSGAWRLVGDQARPVTIEHPVLSRVRPAAIAEARAVAERICFDARANAEARRKLEAPYLLNTLQNLPVLAREADAAALTSKFERMPAVLVAAGPSLDRQLHGLRAVQDRALIVAVDTALRPLLLAGVKPHFVVAVDPSAANALHLEGLPPEHGAWMVGECSLHPTAFDAFSGRTFCYRVAEHEPWPWLRAAGLEAGFLRAWGSVLTTAFDLTLRMGCDPIVFVGADLAYTDGRPYCRATIYENDWARATARGQDLQAVWSQWLETGAVGRGAGLDGTDVVTAPRLVPLSAPILGLFPP